MKNKDTETVEVKVTGIAASDMAAFCDFGDKKLWVPFSVMDEDSRAEARNAQPEDIVELEIHSWFLIDKGVV